MALDTLCDVAPPAAPAAPWTREGRILLIDPIKGSYPRSYVIFCGDYQCRDELIDNALCDEADASSARFVVQYDDGLIDSVTFPFKQTQFVSFDDLRARYIGKRASVQRYSLPTDEEIFGPGLCDTLDTKLCDELCILGGTDDGKVLGTSHSWKGNPRPEYYPCWD